jgi:hypothetical protein
LAARTSIASDTTFQLDLSARGYQVLFWRGAVNRCPGCGHSQWYIGRVTAECGICGTALPINEATQAGLSPSGRRAIALHVVDSGHVADPGLESAASDPRAGQKERRRHPRVETEGRTIALHIDGSSHAFAIKDLSAGGVQGVAIPGISGAGRLIVELEDGTMLPAELKWSDGEFAGLAFVK